MSVGTTDSGRRRVHSGFFRFMWDSLGRATDGSIYFYAWMFALSALALVGAGAWASQVANGMGVTGMSDHVSWGLYIANFTFIVGLAAGAVMMVIPAYLYHDEEMHDVVLIGEMLAIASVIMCLLFVVADLGRPDRFWHLIPGPGRFNWPISMLAWDVIVLNGYLILNLQVVTYLIYKRYRGERPRRRWYLPFVFISIVWAISIHTVTAFLYSGLGGRPFWNTAILAPRFIASAFVTGPAFIIITLQIIERLVPVWKAHGPIETLTKIMRVTILLNLFLVVAEAFTQFYTGGHHDDAAQYLYFGTHGHSALVPWIWTALVLNVSAAAILLIARKDSTYKWLNIACVLAFVGVWIEKGMGLIIPGFIPSTMHEIIEYIPTATEWKITVGVWAFGLLLYTVMVKVAAGVFTGEMADRRRRVATGEATATGQVEAPEPSV